ncbi:MAG TPA: acyltransferase family protein [Acidimicrobiales bacterium]|nr:acyltransferase family protein [Acidimicrobiales bacterium]
MTTVLTLEGAPRADGAEGAGAADAAPVAQRDHGGLPHAPALDGVRALAAAAVVGYHLGIHWLKGGYLGVSLFFTLSGYLITNLLLAERRTTGGTSLPTFWARRARRLLPAAFAGIALAVVAVLVAGTADQLAHIRGDVVAAVLYVANWRFVLGHSAYAAGYQAPSPLLHYWSLAIEEQAYVVLPLLLVLSFRGRGSRRRFTCVIAGLMAASVVATLVVHDSNRAYFGTDTRSFELLAGAALALAIGFPGTAGARRVPRRVAAALAAAAVVVTAALWATVAETSSWLTKGGLWGVAAASCALLVGAQAGGRLAKALSLRPLVALGKRSYGVYVYHWPLFLLISPATVGLHGLALMACRVAATAFAAGVSYRWLEQPIRRGVWPARRPRRLLVLAPVVAGALVAAGTVAGARAADRAIARPTTLVALPAPAPAAPSPSPSPQAAPLAPPGRVLFMGDSLMQQLFPTLANRLGAQGTTAEVIGGGGQSLMSHGAAWLTSLQREVGSFDPDVVVLESCCGNFRFDPPWVGPNGQVVPDDTFAFWTEWRRLATQATEIASSRGAVVLWVLGPPMHTNGWYGPIDGRVPIVNGVYRSIVACDPGAATVDWSVLGGPGGSFAPSLPDTSGHLVPIRLSDGFHFTPAGWDLQARATLPAIAAAWAADHGRSSPWHGACS